MASIQARLRLYLDTVQPCNLTDEGHDKAPEQGHGKIVEGVVVAVHLRRQEGADEKRTLYVVVPRSEGLQPWHDFVHPLAGDQFKGKHFGLSFGLKNRFRFPIL